MTNPLMGLDIDYQYLPNNARCLPKNPSYKVAVGEIFLPATYHNYDIYMALQGQ